MARKNWIAEYSKDQGSDRLKAVEIGSKLEFGAAIIGEQHDDARARVIIGELLEQGKIKRLFLELPSDAQNNGTKHLRDIADLESAEERKAKFKERNTDTLIDHLSTYGQIRTKNPIKLLNLWRRAVKCGCKIYLIDDGLNMPKATLSSRNKISAKMYKETTNGDEKGCVLLCGSAHIDPKEVGSQTLQALTGIANDRCFDLSPSS